MKGFVLTLATLTLSGGAALAAPPTVTPSPGYDARLQEQRSANPPAPNQPIASHSHVRHKPRKSASTAR